MKLSPKIKQASQKTLQSIKISIPMILAILMLISLINPILQSHYTKFFTGNYLIDPIIGALLGSIAFGIPITAYITGGELLSSGVSLLAVTAFILTWTTVGIAMLPLEAKFLGKKLAITRNMVNFIVAIIITILTIVTIGVIT